MKVMCDTCEEIVFTDYGFKSNESFRHKKERLFLKKREIEESEASEELYRAIVENKIPSGFTPEVQQVFVQFYMHRGHDWTVL